MAQSSADVVIVGGGLAGMTTAYYLAKSGVPSVVVERDAIGSHASGFAYGGLSPLSGFGIPGPLAEIAQDGMQLHRELSKSLLEETGIDVDFRVRSSLALAFTEADVRRLPVRQSNVPSAGATTTQRPRPTASCGRGPPRKKQASMRSRRMRPATRSALRS